MTDIDTLTDEERLFVLSIIDVFLAQAKRRQALLDNIATSVRRKMEGTDTRVRIERVK